MSRTIKWYVLRGSGKAALWALYIAVAITVLMGCTTIAQHVKP